MRSSFREGRCPYSLFFCQESQGNLLWFACRSLLRDRPKRVVWAEFVLTKSSISCRSASAQKEPCIYDINPQSQLSRKKHVFIVYSLATILYHHWCLIWKAQKPQASPNAAWTHSDIWEASWYPVMKTSILPLLQQHEVCCQSSDMNPRWLDVEQG